MRGAEAIGESVFDHVEPGWKEHRGVLWPLRVLISRIRKVITDPQAPEVMECTRLGRLMSYGERFSELFGPMSSRESFVQPPQPSEKPSRE